MTSTYIRLAAPLQSWATARVSGNIVHTESIPSRSALCGLIASSCGFNRNAWAEWIHEVDLTLRLDNAGTLVDDFHTIGPRNEDIEFQQRFWTLTTGKKWSKNGILTPDARAGTSIVNRTYLAHATFLAEISHPVQGERIYKALRNPVFTNYLGKKAFAPTFPFVLGKGPAGLLQTLPTCADNHFEGDTPDGTEGTVPLQLVDLDDSTQKYQRVWVRALPKDQWLEQIRKHLTL
ncbi:MAG: type I-E CRISPR-associated protein Cas5/CasD [Actinomycetaceae bacterium]|nr:type I-E CRISPR-associated protein Cas5/CasD [Actinomycetaceae bacterium]